MVIEPDAVVNGRVGHWQRKRAHRSAQPEAAGVVQHDLTSRIRTASLELKVRLTHVEEARRAQSTTLLPASHDAESINRPFAAVGGRCDHEPPRLIAKRYAV